MTERIGSSASFDVVVVGAGLAGFCAALSATEAGARVLLIEKQGKAGGSTVLSGGFFAFADTPEQAAQGVSDSAELLLDDLRSVAGDEADEALIAAYSRGQNQLYRWLVRLGTSFADLELSAGQSVPRSHRTDPDALIGRLSHCFTEAGGTVLYDTRAIRILRPRPEGPVTGLVVASGEGEQAIEASAVVLTTGGFVWSDDLLGNFAPHQKAALRVGGLGNTGDGLRMAWQLGAAFRDMGQIKGTFGAHPETRPERHEIMLAFYLGAVMVNRQGRRFIDESVSYKLLGDACLAQMPDRMAFQVLDQTIFENSPPGVPLFDLRPALDRGLLIRADTLEALAEKCGTDAAALKETIALYNADVEKGRDSAFGRDGLCNHAGALVPIAKPPFYAYPSTTVLLATYCGLTIDPHARVIDIAGRPIEGLYAAGEIAGGFHGVAYMTGSSLGKSAFFGRVAGQSAAALARVVS